MLQIIMAAVFTLSAGYIIWCLYKATRYMRKHPDEFRWSSDEHPHKKTENKKNISDMYNKDKRHYESPSTEVVEMRMESGILTVSNGSPEDRQNGGLWGDGSWF